MDLGSPGAMIRPFEALPRVSALAFARLAVSTAASWLRVPYPETPIYLI